MSAPEAPRDISWPKPPDKPSDAEVEFAKAYYQAQIDEVKARYQAEVDTVKARWQDEIAADAEARKLNAARQDSSQAMEDKLLEAIHAAYLDVAKGTLDRAIERANYITTAAGAIGTIYTGLLALVYSVSGTTPNPLPLRGIAPGIFLGLSLVLSAFYVAYIRGGTDIREWLAGGTGVQLQEQRMLTFMDWVVDSVVSRAWALRMSVVSLGIGIVLIPLPFLTVSIPLTRIVVGAAVLIFAATLLFELVQFFRQRSNSTDFEPESDGDT